MSEEQRMFEEALKQEVEFLNLDFESLKIMGGFLGTHKPYFQDFYKAYRNKEPLYENKPQIGAKVTVTFAWDTKEVRLERVDTMLDFTLSQFLRFLGLVDVCFSEVYPIGSVVALDIEQLPIEIQAIFKGNEPGALVSIAGRRVPLKGAYSDYYMDYITYLWPFGEMDGQSPIVVSNMLMRRVITSGLVNEFEKNFVTKYLREKILEDKKISFAFVPESEIEEEKRHGE